MDAVSVCLVLSLSIPNATLLARIFSRYINIEARETHAASSTYPIDTALPWIDLGCRILDLEVKTLHSSSVRCIPSENLPENLSKHEGPVGSSEPLHRARHFP